MRKGAEKTREVVVFLLDLLFDIDFKGSAEKAEEAVDYIKFGRYPQTAKGEVRPVEWRVLAREDNKALVISRYGLDARCFDPDSNDWSGSEIRRWLNGEFYNITFSDEEKARIESFFSGEENARIKSFNQDNVFLLSFEEAKKYFANEVSRRCKPTAYAKAKGVFEYEGYCYWWLRSSGSEYYSSDVCDVNDDDDVDSDIEVCVVNDDGDLNSEIVDFDEHSVRPALWINLES